MVAACYLQMHVFQVSEVTVKVLFCSKVKKLMNSMHSRAFVDD